MSKSKNSEDISLVVNDESRHVKPEAHSNLLAYLRTELRLTGTKVGCEMGNCGACTVLIDGAPVQSCQINLRAVAGSDISTVENIVKTPLGNQIAKTLTRYDAAQCGYCLPGIVVAAYVALLDTESPDAIAMLQRNLCRCGTHSRILNALQEVITERAAST